MNEQLTNENDVTSQLRELVDGFVANATDAEIDELLKEGNADFYNQVEDAPLLSLNDFAVHYFTGSFTVAKDLSRICESYPGLASWSNFHQPVRRLETNYAADRNDLALAA